MKTLTTNPAQFMDEAEIMLREEAARKGLTVWRGNFAGFFYPYGEVRTCIVVGIGDDTKPPEKSLATLAICQTDPDGAMMIESDDESESVPFRGGWHPL